MSFTSEMVQEAFRALAGDTNQIIREAQGSTVEDWRTAQVTKGALSGAAAAIIPVAGYLTLPADLAYVMRLIHRTATGICAIGLGDADDETFSHILGVWSGGIELNEELERQLRTKVLAKAGVAVGGTVGFTYAVQALTLVANTMLHSKLSPKIAAKVATKLAAKMGTKAVTRWIPVLSAVAGGGVNIWVVNGVARSATEYVRFIQSVSQR